VHYLRSRHAEALHWSAIAVDEARAGGDPADLAYAYNLRDLTLTGAGEVSEEKFGELALASYELSGDLDGQAKCLINLGIRAFQQGEWLLAAERYAEAARRCQRVGDTDNEALARYDLAELRIRQRRFDEAGTLLPEAQRLARVADDVELVALIAREMGKARLGQGRTAEARALFDAAYEGLTKAGLGHELIDVGAGLAACRALDGDLPGAIAELDGVVHDARRLRDTSALASLHFLRGSLLVQEGRWSEAESDFVAGRDDPDPGDGGCARALNRLGLARVVSLRTQAEPEGLEEAEESLRRLGVVIPTL
jgi:tetratricopeptide (TPR) repeat protein